MDMPRRAAIIGTNTPPIENNTDTFNVTPLTDDATRDLNTSSTYGVLDDDVYVEDYHVVIKVSFAITGLTALLTSMVAFIAMSRTRKLPRAAKFLAMGLLVFDAGFITMSTIRKFVLHPVINLSFMVCGTMFMQLSYFTVGLMTLERYLMFCRPNFYLRTCSVRTVRKFAVLIWTVNGIAFLIIRYGVCYLKYGPATIYQAGTCNMLVTVHYCIIVALVLGTSFICYWCILRTTRKIACTTHATLSLKSLAVVFKNYKSTALTLVYFLVILFTSFSYIVILVSIRQFNLGISELRISLEVVNIINCFLDPYLYVLWFKETKMECLKLLAPFNSRLGKKVETMRTKIFDIVVSDVSRTVGKLEPPSVVTKYQEAIGIGHIDDNSDYPTKDSHVRY